MMFLTLFLTCLLFCYQSSYAGTSISVYNNYKKEINVKIQGTGVGGCDIILQPGEDDVSDCWCLWGTINYSFCAFTKVGMEDKNSVNATSSLENNFKQGRCPVVTGESLVCSDLSSLGNCYDHAYSCTIDSTGLCHCQTV